VRIPMFGRADSLNVATSAAILAYEAVRQRMATARLSPL
jgi:RNA methyltransferase, TrmH family